jgi:TonB family protein
VCVTKSLHEDLDVEALAAARQWQFTPGMRAGEPVAVLVTIELTFTLK